MDRFTLPKFFFLFTLVKSGASLNPATTRVLNQFCSGEIGFNCFPSFWDELSLVPDKNVSTINPWNVTERVQAYKWILESTNLKIWEPGTTGNIMWGSVIQFWWQKRSGRLRNPLRMEVSGDLISDKSWFGSVNYFLSILPLIGAFKAGVFGEKTLKLEGRARKHFCLDEFCSGDEELKLIVEDYSNYFKLFKNPANLQSRKKLQESWWKVHEQALQSAVNRFGNVLKYQPQLERRFSLGWVHVTKFLQPLNFPTDLNITAMLQSAFPLSVLNDTKSIRRLSKSQKLFAGFCIKLDLLYEAGSGDVFLNFWRTVLRHERKKRLADSIISFLRLFGM